jgi:tRNA(fMet)-specific endonuclease VapC
VTYLFDTDVLSSLLKPTPSATLLVRLAATPIEDQFTSSITVGELIYGASRLSAQRPGLLASIETRLLSNLSVASFDAAAARRYGVLRAGLEAQGTPMAEPDLRIAAIALARGFTLVTGNERHFRRVPGLTLENWLV